MRFVLVLLSLLFLTGCTFTPYKELNLDTTSNFKTPEIGNAGIYVYQWKRGIIGAAFDVDFEIKGSPVISLNTGEYGYFEITPGEYEYKSNGGIFELYSTVEFEANKNYFFHAFLSNLHDNAYLVRSQTEIDEAKKNIVTGRYELHDKD